MSNNREYTGLVRTPSSMAWLIDRRRRLKWKIERLQKSLVDLPMQIAELESQLKSLDEIFPLHELMVKPQVIEGKRPFAPRSLTHGAMTRAIYECLRESRDKGPLYICEIAHHVRRVCNVDAGTIDATKFSRKLGWRLKNLSRGGELIRHHELVPGNREEGRWSIAA